MGQSAEHPPYTFNSDELTSYDSLPEYNRNFHSSFLHHRKTTQTCLPLNEDKTQSSGLVHSVHCFTVDQVGYLHLTLIPLKWLVRNIALVGLRTVLCI